MSRAPDFRLTVNGRDITPTVANRLVRLTLSDKEGLEADTLDITLSDHDSQLEMPPRGALISLHLGFVGEPLLDKGTYHVDEVEHVGAPDQLTIRARSADLMSDLPGKKSRSWNEVTVGDIVRQIADEHGLEPVITDALARLRRVSTHQTDESDLNLLTRLGDTYDAIVTVKSGHLLFLPVGRAERVTGARMPGITLRRSDHDGHSYTRSERVAYTGVRAKWHNFDTGDFDYVLAGTDARVTDLEGSFSTADEALQAAESDLRQRRRQGASLTLSLSTGAPELVPETPLTCQGWPADIDAIEWLISEVTHQLDDAGLTTRCTCYREDTT